MKKRTPRAVSSARYMDAEQKHIEAVIDGVTMSSIQLDVESDEANDVAAAAGLVIAPFRGE